jgi:thymidylate synthase
VNANGVFNEAYWADLVRLLEVFDATGDVSRINALKAQFMSPIYQSYLDGRLSMRRRKPDTQTQPGLGL